MESYIGQVEKFLRGQMTKQEVITFKTSLATNPQLHSFAIIVINILRNKKSR